MNYFEYYGLPISFDVDKKALRSAFLIKSREVHPDVATDAEKALEEAAFNNTAYATLSENGATLKYILDLFDVEVQALPNDFLMDMMELNEEIEEALLSGHIGDDIVTKINGFENALQTEYAPFLTSFSSEDISVLEKAAAYYAKLKYIRRLRNHLSGQSSEM